MRCTFVRHICARGTRRVSDFDQLVQASRLYYELGETQNAIAERLGVTRPQVSRLLKRARAEGIVEIRIVDRTAAESPAADSLRRRYGLDAVHLAPTLAGPEDLTRRMVGRLAAQVLRARDPRRRDRRHRRRRVGRRVADALEDAATPVAATVVPLAGGYWSTGPERDPFRRIADALGARPAGSWRPASSTMPPRNGARGACRRARDHRPVGPARRRAVRDRRAVWSTASRRPDVVGKLDAAGAVGEILIAPFDLDGRVRLPGAARSGRSRSMRGARAVPDRDRRGRRARARCAPILGALRAGVVRTLVTDVATAEAVVALDARAARPRPGTRR